MSQRTAEEQEMFHLAVRMGFSYSQAWRIVDRYLGAPDGKRRRPKRDFDPQREWAALMTQIPATRDHRGTKQSRHTTGAS